MLAAGTVSPAAFALPYKLAIIAAAMAWKTRNILATPGSGMPVLWLLQWLR